MMAVALEREDYDRYWEAALSGNVNMKKYPKPFNQQEPSMNQIMAIAQAASKSKSIQNAPKGNPFEYGRATGKKIVLYSPKTDSYYDEDGNKYSQEQYDPATMFRWRPRPGQELPFQIPED